MEDRALVTVVALVHQDHSDPAGPKGPTGATGGTGDPGATGLYHLDYCVLPLFIGLRETYTVVHKKQDTKLLSITLPNNDRFSKFYHCYTEQEIYNKAIIADSATP